MEREDIEPIKIKTYKLPLIYRLARRRNLYFSLTTLAILFIIDLSILVAYDFKDIIYIYLIPTYLIALYEFFNLFRNVSYEANHNRFKNDCKTRKGNIYVNQGDPGSGKSYVGMYETYYMAQGSFEELQWEYFQLIPKLLDKDYVMSSHDKEIYDSYRATVKGQGIPCAMTNTPMYSLEYKRYSYKLKPEHFKCQEKLPYRYTFFCDEVGTFCGPELCRDSNNEMRSAEIGDFGRFSRQWLEMRGTMAEQDANNVYINFRRVIAGVRTMIDFTPVLKPKILTAIFLKFRHYLINRMSINKSLIWARFMSIIDKYISCCGYFKVTYRQHRNSQIKSSDGSEVYTETTKRRNGDVIYLPSAKPFHYETRAFASSYPLILNRLILEPFIKSSMETFESQIYLRSYFAAEKIRIKIEKEVSKKRK